MLRLLLVLQLCILHTSLSLSLPEGFITYTLYPGWKHECCVTEPYSTHRSIPVVYCFSGLRKGIFRLFISVHVETTLTTDSFDLYMGNDSKEVFEQFEAQRFFWVVKWMMWKQKEIELNPFNSSCFGIHTDKNYTLTLNIVDMDYSLLALHIVGIMLFLLSPMFAESNVFYYLAAALVGVSTSFIIALYFLLKLFSFKKTVLIGAMAGGTTIMSMLLQTLYENIYPVLHNYLKYVMVYIFSTTFISMILYYRLGPITDPRSKFIIRLMLQIIASVCLLYSSYYTEMVLIIITLLAIAVNVDATKKIPIINKIGHFGFKIWKYLKRMSSMQQRRLLTLREYEEEGRKETCLALYNLREYVRSPQFIQSGIDKRLSHSEKLYPFALGVRDHVSLKETRSHNLIIQSSSTCVSQTDDSDELE